jgi:tRNA G18 (ribose-2'-O)-methylase SpoU
MHRVQPVRDLELPELAPYRTMRWQNEQRKQGIFVAEGEKVVRRLLESHLIVVSLLIPEKWAEIYRPLLERHAETFTVYTAEKRLLESLTGFSMYQGVLAVGRVPEPVSLEAAVTNAPAPRLFVAVDEVSSAENLGGLVRNCVAFGAHAIIVGETCCSPYMRRAVRSSMGTVFKLPVVETTKLAGSLRWLRERGIRVIAAHPHTERKWLPESNFTGDTAIVLGSEGKGITPEVLAACDEAVAIPMRNEVDSLNVGDAGAVFLYEAFRQRAVSLRQDR